MQGGGGPRGNAAIKMHFLLQWSASGVKSSCNCASKGFGKKQIPAYNMATKSSTIDFIFGGAPCGGQLYNWWPLCLYLGICFVFDKQMLQSPAAGFDSTGCVFCFIQKRFNTVFNRSPTLLAATDASSLKHAPPSSSCSDDLNYEQWADLLLYIFCSFLC